MSLNFPSKPEVRLGRSPLVEVICQVKFSPILRIAKELPIDFQDAIRGRFPSLEYGQGLLLQFPSLINTEKPSMEVSPKIYRFKTFDGEANVSLSIDFFALTTRKYTHWRDFIDDLDMVARAVLDLYHPPFATRIGLRYINHFTRINTGSQTFREILDLFRGELTCLLRSEAWTEPTEMFLQLVLNDDQAKMTLRTGLGKEQEEPFFLLDFDYFEEGQLGLENLTERVEIYHSKIYDAFRWCLFDDALVKFEPLLGE